MKVEFGEYRAILQKQFEGIKEDPISDLDDRLVRFISVEHVGSTAVPSLLGKSMMDTLILLLRKIPLI